MHTLQFPSSLIRMLRNRQGLQRIFFASDVADPQQSLTETKSDSGYSQDQEAVILKTINECSAEEITRFEITKSLAQKVEEYRKNNGQFLVLQDLLKVKGIGARIVEKLCNNILNLPKKEVVKEKKKKEGTKFIIPSLESDVKAQLQNAVGIHIGPQSYSWASINRSGHLQLWDCAELIPPKRLHITNTFQIALNMLDTLPPATLYLIEDGPTVLHSNSQVSLTPFIAYQLQLVAMLVTLLNTPSNDSNADSSSPVPRQKVYFMQPRLTSRLFNVMVGNERVSTQAVVQDILTFSVASHFSPVSFDPILKDTYFSRKGVEKETMCLSLLLTMAFFDLVVHKNPESLKTVSKKRSQK